MGKVKVVDVQSEEPKLEEVKSEETKVEEVTPEEPPKVEEHKVEEPKVEAPKTEEVKPKPKRVRPPPKPKVVETPPPPPPVETTLSQTKFLPRNSLANFDETKAKKEPVMMTCPHCNKSMTAKTLKYSHMKVCGSATPRPAPQAPAPAPAPAPRVVEKPAPSPTTVSFDPYQSQAQSHAILLQQHREQRLLAKQARVKHLISQAF
jgi:hypothetical protein